MHSTPTLCHAAHNATLKAAVAFYGPPVDPPNPLWPKSPTQLAPDMKAPVLGLYGEADTGIPVALPQGSRGRRVEPDAGLAEEIQRAELTGSISIERARCLLGTIAVARACRAGLRPPQEPTTHAQIDRLRR